AGGHLHVVTEEVALRRGQVGPEDLFEVAHFERVAVRKGDDALLAAVLEVLQLIDDELEGLGRGWDVAGVCGRSPGLKPRPTADSGRRLLRRAANLCHVRQALQ